MTLLIISQEPPLQDRHSYYPVAPGWPEANSKCISHNMRMHTYAHYFGCQRMKGNALRWLGQSSRKLAKFLRGLDRDDRESWAESSKIHYHVYEAIKCVYSVEDLARVWHAREEMIRLVLLLEDYVYQPTNTRLNPPAWRTNVHWRTKITPDMNRHLARGTRSVGEARSSSPGLTSPGMTSVSDMSLPSTMGNDSLNNDISTPGEPNEDSKAW